MFAFSSFARCGVVLDGHQRAAGFAQTEPDPDRAVAARASDFERARRAARGDQQPQEAAILLRDREHALVGRPDLVEQRVDGRRHPRRRDGCRRLAANIDRERDGESGDEEGEWSH